MPLFVFLVCKMGMCDCVARLLRINVIEHPEVGYICL